MADGNEIESGLLMEVTTAQNSLTQTAPVQIVTVADGDVTVPENGQVTEDILQQALVGAEDFVQNAVDYASGEKVDDGSVAAEIVNNVIAESSLVTTVGDEVSETSIYVGPEEFDVVGTEAQVESADVGMVQDGQQIQTNDMIESDTSNNNITVMEHTIMEETETVSEADSQTVVASNQATHTAGNVSVAVIPATTNLGTSHNPIRIIQQGNQYTPVQQLTAEQLQQIMQVVQQQQLAKSSSSASGSSILFNPQTNTRIVYRVIYPSELHKNSASGSQINQSGLPQNILVQQKRPYRKRPREEDDDKQEGPELTKEEKDERKKHRPRTRSGRVSKPPKHMMKDYKHIHVLDWDEDYDDSDGGYSDYKCSDEEKQRRNEEGEAMEREMEGTYVYPGLGSTRPKNYKCSTCEKAYIGQAGLGRHYRLNPSHGSIPESELEIDNKDGIGRTNGNMGSLSEDSNTQDSIPGGMEMNSGTPGTPSPVSKRAYVHSGRGRGRGRHLQELSLSRRKSKLKEIVRQCEDEDLMEVVLPRLAKVITLWEFLLMKVERGYPSRPHADDIFKEFESLHKQVQKACQTYLTPLNKDSVAANSTRTLQVENAQLAQALGLDVGLYDVKDMPVEETSTFQCKQTPEKIPLSRPSNVNRKLHETSSQHLPGQFIVKRPKSVSILDTSPVRNVISSSSTVHKGSNLQFRVVSAGSSTSAAPDTPHIIAVSHPQMVGVNNNIGAAPHIVTVSNPNIVSNTVKVMNPHTSTVSTPKVLSVNSNQQTLSHQGVTMAMTDIQPPLSVQSQDGGADKSHEILTSQAASTSTIISNSSQMGDVMELGHTDITSQSDSSVINSATVVSSSAITSANNSIVSAPSESVALRTVLVNGNVTNSADVKHLQPLVQQALQTDISNIQVVNSLEEAQQILAQSQMNGVDQSSNITTLAEVVHNETEFIAQDHVTDNKEEITAMEVKEEVNDGQVEGEGQVLDQDQIVTHSNIYQTEDGILIIQNPDGTTFQLQGAEGIPLETVQALLAMEGQFEGGEQVQAELQQ